jgi:hypothetical protein
MIVESCQEVAMITNLRVRRALSVGLLVLGGVLVFLAPGDIWIGILMLALGLGLEVAGTLMRHRLG